MINTNLDILIDKKSLTGLGVRVKDINLSAPTPKKIDIDLPLADGTIYTTPLGIPIFNNRTLEITVDYRPRNFADAYAMQSKLLALCYANEKQQLVLNWDKNFFYFGRCEDVTMEREYDIYCTYVIQYTCEPYKLDINLAGEPWLWNPFNFLNGIIYSGVQNITGSGYATVINRTKPVVPIIKVTKPCTITHENKTYQLNVGSNRIADIVLMAGTNKFLVKGDTSITFSYLAGEL